MVVQDSERKRRGKMAESVICQFLIKRGCTILDRNFVVAGIGEIDIVAAKNEIVYFVEVRARQQNSSFGNPLESINQSKLRKIRKTASIYISNKGIMNSEISILAASVLLNSKGEIVSFDIVPVESL